MYLNIKLTLFSLSFQIYSIFKDLDLVHIMPKQKLCSNSFPKERDAQSGHYTAHCSCINHNDWSFIYIYKEINIKKSSRFGENIINQMCRDGIIPQFANIVSMQCYSTYKNR